LQAKFIAGRRIYKKGLMFCTINLCWHGFSILYPVNFRKMKKNFTLAVMAALLVSFATMLSIDEVVNAFKSGNASQAAKFFDNTVEISMPDKSNSYSKSQAEAVLKDFFSNNGVKGFETSHKGENSGNQYCIGTLSTKNGSFRTTIYMKQKGDKQLVQEIRFEGK
jgi:hypothetical protein